LKRNLIYILIGFLFGQGSMFLVQTYLITQNLFELIANVGIALGLLSLIQWATDGGGVFFLSKYEQENSLEQNLGVFIQARLIIGCSFTCLMLLPLFFFELVSDVVIEVFIFSPFVVLIWAFNLTGVADSRNKNKILGPISGLSWCLSSLLLFFFYECEYLSYIIGSGYCLGLLFTVFIQIKILKVSVKDLVRFKNLRSCVRMLKLVLGYTSAYISAQGYARVIPILISYSIDGVTAGMYVYAKNFTNSISQLIIFSRRVEFTKLVSALKFDFKIKDVFFAQKVSLIIALAIGSIIMVFYFLTFMIDTFQQYRLVIMFSMVMAALQVLWVFSSSLGQVLVVQDDTRYYSLVIFFSSFFSMCFIFLFINEVNVFSVFISEALMFLIQIYFYFKRIKSNDKW